MRGRKVGMAEGFLSQTVDSKLDVIERVLGEFIVLDNVMPDWLVDPKTGRRLVIDKLYPELGIAIRFKGALEGRGDRSKGADHDKLVADLCRRAGFALVAVDAGGDAFSQTLAEMRTALSAAARRVAQQRVAREVKLDLLPRIASAKSTCQRLLEAMAEAPSPYRAGRWQRRRLRLRARWRRFKEGWQVFAQSRLALLGVVLIVMFGLMSIAHPVLMSTVWSFKIYNPDTGFDESLMVHPSPPSAGHLLGTDVVGRDVLSLLLVSTTSTFVVGLTAAVTTAGIGTILGVISAYFKGIVDVILGRLADVFLLLPAPIVMVIIGAKFYEIRPAMFGLIYGLIAGVGGAAIVMRSHALTVMTKPFIGAARVAGGGARHIILTHVVPHMLPLAAVYMMVTVTGAVVADGFVSFLGVTRVHHNWGTMIYMALAYKGLINDVTPWNVLIPPSVAFSLFAAAFYFISRGLHKVAEPRLRER